MFYFRNVRPARAGHFIYSYIFKICQNYYEYKIHQNTQLSWGDHSVSWRTSSTENFAGLHHSVLRHGLEGGRTMKLLGEKHQGCGEVFGMMTLKLPQNFLCIWPVKSLLNNIEWWYMIKIDLHWFSWSTCSGSHREPSLSSVPLVLVLGLCKETIHPKLQLQALGKLFGDGPAVPHQDGNTEVVPTDIMGSKMRDEKPGTRLNWSIPGVASELGWVFDTHIVRFVDWGMPLQSASLSQAGPTLSGECSILFPLATGLYSRRKIRNHEPYWSYCSFARADNKSTLRVVSQFALYSVQCSLSVIPPAFCLGSSFAGSSFGLRNGEPRELQQLLENSSTPGWVIDNSKTRSAICICSWKSQKKYWTKLYFRSAWFLVLSKMSKKWTRNQP